VHEADVSRSSHVLQLAIKVCDEGYGENAGVPPGRGTQGQVAAHIDAARCNRRAVSAVAASIDQHQMCRKYQLHVEHTSPRTSNPEQTKPDRARVEAVAIGEAIRLDTGVAERDDAADAHDGEDKREHAGRRRGYSVCTEDESNSEREEAVCECEYGQAHHEWIAEGVVKGASFVRCRPPCPCICRGHTITAVAATAIGIGRRQSKTHDVCTHTAILSAYEAVRLDPWEYCGQGMERHA
jgi:hypothetical protein